MKLLKRPLLQLTLGAGPLAVLGSLLLTGSAVADTSLGAPSSDQSAGDCEKSSLEEIIVTATRREESLEKVPISIGVLTQNDLNEAGIKSIADIAAVTPGLQFAIPTGFASSLTAISIRGSNTLSGASVVGLYLDDTPIQARLVPIGNVGSPYPVVFDLNRVEVDRGPQGTLFGAGSEAGTVRFITNEPSLTQFSGFSHAELASTQNGGVSYEAGAAAGGPIVDDKIGFRVSVWDRHDGGYIDLVDPASGNANAPVTARNVNTDDKLALKVALAVQVNEDIRITPSVFYQSIHIGDSGRFYGNFFSNPSTGHFDDGTFFPETSTDRFTLPSLKIEAHLPFAELTSVTSYMDRTVYLANDVSAFLSGIGLVSYGNPLGPAFPASPSDVGTQLTGQTIHGFTEEVRLTSNRQDAFLTWVTGIFYDHHNQEDYATYYSLAIDPTGANVGNLHQLTTDEQVAVFAQGDFHLTNKLTATLGGREADVRSDQRNNNGTGALNAGQPPVQYAGEKETPFTPKVALSYQADRNNLLYISASEGFRIGGGNVALPSNCDANGPSGYGADYVRSYEVGAKDNLFDGRVQIDSSVFHANWIKIQQQVYLPCGFGYTTNTGGATSNGFDLALQTLVTDRLRVNLDVGYVNAYFTKTVLDSAGRPVVLAGDKVGFLPLVNPPWDVNTSADYEIPFAQGANIHLRGEFQYHSRNPGPFVDQIPTSPQYFPQLVADPPTHLTNVRVGTTIHKMDVTLFVNNVFNSHPQLSAYQWTNTSNLVTNATLRPRTVGLSANIPF